MILLIVAGQHYGFLNDKTWLPEMIITFVKHSSWTLWHILVQTFIQFVNLPQMGDHVGCKNRLNILSLNFSAKQRCFLSGNINSKEFFSWWMFNSASISALHSYRITIGIQTCIFEKEHDPTILRSPSAGKLVQFMVEEGAHVGAGHVYAEIEVMKLIMSLKTSESGR